MRKAESGSFVASLLLNLVINALYCIPGIVLLILHFVLDISVWWAVGALVVWVLWVLIATCGLCFVSECSNEPKPVRENKNPYSASNAETFGKKDDGEMQ